MKTMVPYDRLRPETLRALIEEFVTRDGAIHGHRDTPLRQHVASVRARLVSGEVVIVFDDEDESCTICGAEDFRDAQGGVMRARTRRRATEHGRSTPAQ